MRMMYRLYNAMKLDKVIIALEAMMLFYIGPWLILKVGWQIKKRKKERNFVGLQLHGKFECEQIDAC